MPFFRPAHRARACIAVTLVAAGGLLAACGSSSPAATGPSASSLAKQALANAAVGGWVHESTTATEPGHSYVSSNDVGEAAGRQVIKVDATNATVVLVDHTAYIRGNESAITHFFQLPTHHPQRYVGTWIRFGSASSGYKTVTNAVTLASDFSQVVILGPLTTGATTTIGGQRVIPIHGHVKGSSAGATVPATLYVTATGKVLPVEFTVSNGSITVTTRWTRWGHRVVLVAPSPSIPFTSVKN